MPEYFSKAVFSRQGGSYSLLLHRHNFVIRNQYQRPDLDKNNEQSQSQLA
ncbi:MAG: hypothetical protein QOK66_04375 [Nitrososphaeraceae archaeon]|nr:hypothetical protein [Nitrososphaeraceae archaeon]